MPEFWIRQADWVRDHAALAAIRRAVFIHEQGVPEALEWDEHDAASVHWLAQDTHGEAIGCARLLPDGHIGRMAVLPAWRSRGVGRALLDAVIVEAHTLGHRVLKLSAQIHAAGFYEGAGFAVVGTPYDEAGIPHVAMQKTLSC